MCRDALSLAKILLLDPFHGGSHAMFTDRLRSRLQADWQVHTLPARHWKWRMRGAAVHLATRIRPQPPDLVVTTSMLALADLKGLAPQLVGVPSFVYFHENQLAYPDREGRDRDHHFGFTQLISARAATMCGFNSQYNLESFLDAGERLLGALPDAVPRQWTEDIRKKSRVLPFPLDLPEGFRSPALTARGPAPAPEPDDGRAASFSQAPEPARAPPEGPIILWNHRWEHDKRPEAFFEALAAVDGRGVSFRLAIAGPRYERWPACFDRAQERWADRIIQFGPSHTRAEYERLLSRADIAVSTAAHEFFGVSMLEATHFGAYPLVPDRLAYPEIFAAPHRYRDDADLVDRLEACIRARCAGRPLRADRRAITAPYGRPALRALADVFAHLSGRTIRLTNMESRERM